MRTHSCTDIKVHARTQQVCCAGGCVQAFLSHAAFGVRFFVLLMSVVFGVAVAPRPAIADDFITPAVHADNSDEIDAAALLAQRKAYLAQLKSEIAAVDSEMARCKRANSNWKVATVVGSVGTAATATGAIIQASKINKAKKAGMTATRASKDKGQKE